jgi:hypothetical protein
MAYPHNSLPDIAEAAITLDSVDEDTFSALRDILSKYGLCSYFGISLVHRHFDLFDDEERLVDLVDRVGRNVVSSVFRNCVPNPQIVADYNLAVPEHPKVFGSMFIVDDLGLTPYEYSCTSEEAAIKYATTIQNLDPGFLADWLTVLKRERLCSKLGLALLEGSVAGGLERSYPSKRVNVVTFGDLTGSWIPTVWHVGDSGNLVSKDGCVCEGLVPCIFECGNYVVIAEKCDRCGGQN